MDSCCICNEPLGAPVYESERLVSITSLCQVLEGPTRVWHCANCGHTQTAPLPALGEGSVCEWCAARGLCRKDFWNE